MLKLDQDKIYQIYFETALLYNEILNSEEGKNGLEYLSKRGLSLKNLNENLVGFAPRSKSKQFLYSNLIGKFSPIDLLSSKIINLNEKEGILKDYFGSQRIIFPIFENGKIISFSGRTIIQNVEPRYKTLVCPFSSKVGVFNCSILKSNPKKIYICEGIIDSLTMIEMGFDTIGIIGTKVFGKENLDIFAGYSGDIVLLLDTDSNESGKKAARKIASLFHSNGMYNIYAKYIEKPELSNKMDINELYLKNKSIAFAIISGLPQIKMEVEEIEKKSTNSNRSLNKKDFDIVREISKIKELKDESSSKMRCCCPFPDHSDSTPSFVVYVDDNRFKCFGCGRSGDTIEFVKEYYGMSFKDALSFLSNQ